jgi:hypothetical protein
VAVVNDPIVDGDENFAESLTDNLVVYTDVGQYLAANKGMIIKQLSN